MKNNTYSCYAEFEDFRVIGLLHVLDFPRSGGVVANCLFLGEFYVVELPSGGHIGVVGQVNVDCSALLDVHSAEVKLIHGVIILRKEIGEDLHLWSHQDTVKEELLLVTVGEISDQLAISFISDGHGPLSIVAGWWSQELDVHLHDLKRLQAEHGLNFGLQDLAAGLCFGICAAEWMYGATVGLGLDNFEWPVEVQVEGQVSLRVIRERQFLDLLWSLFFSLNRPVFESHMVLAIHLELSIN